MNQIIILGSSDAGISAKGLRIEMIRNPEVTILLKDEYPNFSICGLPFISAGKWKTGKTWPAAWLN
ncbi:MAG: hypothetical protein R2874_15440 [Desulfobacterales bacterium]